MSLWRSIDGKIYRDESSVWFHQTLAEAASELTKSSTVKSFSFWYAFYKVRSNLAVFLSVKWFFFSGFFARFLPSVCILGELILAQQLVPSRARLIRRLRSKWKKKRERRRGGGLRDLIKRGNWKLSQEKEKSKWKSALLVLWWLYQAHDSSDWTGMLPHWLEQVAECFLLGQCIMSCTSCSDPSPVCTAARCTCRILCSPPDYTLLLPLSCFYYDMTVDSVTH